MVCHYAVIFVSFKPIYLSVCGSTPCTESLNQQAFKLASEEVPFPAHPCLTRLVWIYIEAYCATAKKTHKKLEIPEKSIQRWKEKKKVDFHSLFYDLSCSSFGSSLWESAGQAETIVL